MDSQLLFTTLERVEAKVDHLISLFGEADEELKNEGAAQPDTTVSPATPLSAPVVPPVQDVYSPELAQSQDQLTSFTQSQVPATPPAQVSQDTPASDPPVTNEAGDPVSDPNAAR